MLLSALHQRHAAITQLIHRLIVEEQKELMEEGAGCCGVVGTTVRVVKNRERNGRTYWSVAWEDPLANPMLTSQGCQF